MSTNSVEQAMSMEYLFSSHNIISCPRYLVEITGDMTAGFLLNQMLYWTNAPGQDPEGWIQKDHTEWEAETAIKEWDAIHATDHLLYKGLIKTTTHDFRPYYKIDWDMLTKLTGEYLAKIPGRYQPN